jgi:thiol-disulfide isomerase/thioredoxin
MKGAIILFLSILSIKAGFAQSSEVILEPGGTKVIRGFMSKQDLATDSTFTWFNTNMKAFTPDANSIEALKANKDAINIVAFGGTWCGDTKQVLPQFFSLADAAGFSQDRITLLGVDRGKKTIQHLAEAFHITNVPTFIVMKNGKEVGRVVEYGKTGMPMKELGEIISASAK